jgi:hypothetical protein
MLELIMQEFTWIEMGSSFRDLKSVYHDKLF